jgi:hypothetical protein
MRCWYNLEMQENIPAKRMKTLCVEKKWEIGNIGTRKLMKETKSQNQQACQKEKYTSQKNENIVCQIKHHMMREGG